MQIMRQKYDVVRGLADDGRQQLKNLHDDHR
jgi:hypothetical protein